MSVTNPATIEELKQWYEEHQLPPEEVTRFFIGKDYRGARAFGVYQQGGRYVVYKNKENGSRAVRYDGPDEAYAVKELWTRLKQEITNQKASQPGEENEPVGRMGNAGSAIATIGIVIAMVLAVLAFTSAFGPSDGYYAYTAEDALIEDYYYLGGSWYYFDNGQEYNDYTWHKTKVPSELSKNWEQYYQGKDYSETYGVSDFMDTTYYTDYESSHDSDSYDWGSTDSWDSGYTDFSSDW